MKVHLSEDNELRECHASIKDCPLQHFDSVEEALRIFGEEWGTSSQLTLPIMTFTKDEERLIDALSEVGRPLLVGGAVRDSILGIPSKDLDIEVHSTSMSDLSQQLRSYGYLVDEVGKSFGVLKVSQNGVYEVDVSVPRKEKRTGRGHKNFSIETGDLSLQEAADRRDFTINAIMYDPVRDELIDPTGGVQDLQNGVLRHVSERFSEDPLRVLRGFQFAGRFDATMSPETVDLAKSIKGEYSTLARERVQIEWGKFFRGSKNHNAGLKVLQETEWASLEPGLSQAIDGLSLKIPTTSSPEVIGAAVIGSRMSGSDRKELYSKVLLTEKSRLEAESVVSASQSNLSTGELRRKTATRSNFTFERLSEFAEATSDNNLKASSEEAKGEGIWDHPEPLWIQGKDILKATTKKPGPWVGQIMKEFQRQQYSRSISTKEEALAILSQKLN